MNVQVEWILHIVATCCMSLLSDYFMHVQSSDIRTQRHTHKLFPLCMPSLRVTVHLEILLEDGSSVCTVEIMDNSSLADVRHTLSEMAVDFHRGKGNVKVRIPKDDSYLFVIDGDVIPRDQEAVEDAAVLTSVQLRVVEPRTIPEPGPYALSRTSEV